MSSGSKSIFKDRNKLSPYYIPKSLPHREQQLKLLLSLYEKTMQPTKGIFPRITQIVGNTGSGKTSTAIRFSELITRKAMENGIILKSAYMNCKVDGTTRYVLFGNLVKKLVLQISTRSLSPEETLRQVIEHFRNRNEFLLLIFDEIDYFLQTSPKEHIVYDLTRVPELHPGESCPVIGEIFICRSLKWHRLLEPGESSTLGMGVIEFPRYDAAQIMDILDERVKEAFLQNVVDYEALELLSDITSSAPINGDLRFGLELLYYSGILAENSGSNRLRPDHVRVVHSQINPTITSEDIASLDKSRRLVLLSLIRTLKTSKSAYVGLRDIRQRYEIICEESNFEPIEGFEEHLQDLVFRGIVDMKSLTELGISGVSLIDLERFLGKLENLLRNDTSEKQRNEHMGGT